ncbi:MAG: hypothetical protein WCA46_18505, partial [Actinocatenispora sp.]
MTEREASGSDVTDDDASPGARRVDEEGLEFTGLIEACVEEPAEAAAPAARRVDEEGLEFTGLIEPVEADGGSAGAAVSADTDGAGATDTGTPGGLPRRSGATPRRWPHVDVNPTSMVRAVPEAEPPRRRRDWVDVLDLWYPECYRLPTILTTAVSLALMVVFLYLPVAGPDLSAQVAAGHFFQTYGADTVDFRWFGGVHPFGYSLLAGPLNALIGSRGVGAVCCVLGSAAFAWLLARHRVPRPTLGGLLLAVVSALNLVNGQTTFMLGLAIGMFALVALALPRATRPFRLSLGAVLAALATVASPLAGLFLGLAGGAQLLAAVRRR